MKITSYVNFLVKTKNFVTQMLKIEVGCNDQSQNLFWKLLQTFSLRLD